MSGANSRLFLALVQFIHWFISLSLGSSLGNKTHSSVLKCCFVFVFGFGFGFGFQKPIFPRFSVFAPLIVHLMLYWNCLFIKTVSPTFVYSTTCRMHIVWTWMNKYTNKQMNKWQTECGRLHFFASNFDPSQYPHRLFHVSLQLFSLKEWSIFSLPLTLGLHMWVSLGI